MIGTVAASDDPTIRKIREEIDQLRRTRTDEYMHQVRQLEMVCLIRVICMTIYRGVFACLCTNVMRLFLTLRFYFTSLNRT